MFVCSRPRVIPELEDMWASKFMKIKPALFWFPATCSSIICNKLPKALLFEIADHMWRFYYIDVYRTWCNAVTNFCRLQGCKSISFPIKSKSYCWSYWWTRGHIYLCEYIEIIILIIYITRLHGVELDIKTRSKEIHLIYPFFWETAWWCQVHRIIDSLLYSSSTILPCSMV